MRCEISQYDIPDRQLQAGNDLQKVVVWTDLGEARVIYTIFGRAKVRVIREQDKNLRTGLLAALAVTAITAAAWQGWITSQRTELLHSAPPLPLSARIKVSAPTFQPEYTPSHASPSEESEPKTPDPTATNNPTDRSSAPQQTIGLKATKQMAVKPDTVQPSIASHPQTLATNSDSSMSQTDVPPIPKLSDPIQPEAPSAAPLVKGSISTTLSAGGNQTYETVSTQSK